MTLPQFKKRTPHPHSLRIENGEKQVWQPLLTHLCATSYDITKSKSIKGIEWIGCMSLLQNYTGARKGRLRFFNSLVENASTYTMHEHQTRHMSKTQSLISQDWCSYMVYLLAFSTSDLRYNRTIMGYHWSYHGKQPLTLCLRTMSESNQLSFEHKANSICGILRTMLFHLLEPLGWVMHSPLPTECKARGRY